MKCFLCKSEPRKGVEALCATCVEDLVLLEYEPPPQTSTKEEVEAWAKANNVTIFSCGKKDLEI